MPEQDHFWSRVAASYEREFIDPYRADVRRNPLRRILEAVRDRRPPVVADFGCGIGPLLPSVAALHDRVRGRFRRRRCWKGTCRLRVEDSKNVRFVQAAFTNLQAMPEPVDVAVSVNSLVLPNPDDMDQSLAEIARSLKPQGVFLRYFTRDGRRALLHNAARRSGPRRFGKPIAVARKNAARHCEFPECYDFAFGQFHFR